MKTKSYRLYLGLFVLSFIFSACVEELDDELLGNDPNGTYSYYSSDIVKYALTSHGIKYLLRDKPGTVNSWKVVDTLKNYSVLSDRGGNTDCSGLASAAIRFGGYRHPEDSKKPALSTWNLADAAQNGRHDLAFVGTNKDMRDHVRHGDLMNRTGSPYGHVVLYNGQNSRGLIETVEAKCTLCGVGRFTRSWNEMAQGYRIIRATYIYNDIYDRKQIITLEEASASDRIFTPKQKGQQKMMRAPAAEVYYVQAGEDAHDIAHSFGVSVNELKNANPSVNWSRLQVNQEIKLPL